MGAVLHRRGRGEWHKRRKEECASGARNERDVLQMFEDGKTAEWSTGNGGMEAVKEEHNKVHEGGDNTRRRRGVKRKRGTRRKRPEHRHGRRPKETEETASRAIAVRVIAGESSGRGWGLRREHARRQGIRKRNTQQKERSKGEQSGVGRWRVGQ
jgi:hypothetical protein